MRKCPDCAEENISESLFCKHCGRCLLAPDPEVARLATATHIELHETREDMDFHNGQMVKKPIAYSLKRRHQTRPAVIEGWILFLNVLVFILMFEIARSLVIT